MRPPLTLISSSRTSFGAKGSASPALPTSLQLPVPSSLTTMRSTGSEMAILRVSMAPRRSEPILSQASIERDLEQGLLEASLLIGNFDVVEAKLWCRQNHQMHLAADFNVAAEKLAGLGFEDWPVVVPVNKERRREERAQHQNQHCRKGEQKRVHGSLCLRLDREQSRGYGKAKDSSVQSAHKFDHGNAKILPGLRIFNGSSAFFMAIITSTPAPCSWAR